MKGWLGDLLRTFGAWWYWNTRKTLYVVRGRTGRCPCQNPSDSGQPGETRCDAVVFWHQPQRFAKRVCPLLMRNAEGEWVCRVTAAGVRPFWGRMLASHAAAALIAAVLGGLAVWGTLRAGGFPVSFRQVFWPPAWPEQRQVRADFFREKAEGALAQGRAHEALVLLSTARRIKPDDLASGLLLAQLSHILQPELVDTIYQQLLSHHPAQANEIARLWSRSLLARGQMKLLGQLARAQLGREPQEAAWLHALLTAARWEKNWSLVAAVANDDKVAPEARAICALEVKLRQVTPADAARLLRMAPAPSGAYALVHRVERLLEFGEPFEALVTLRSGRNLVTGRDVARLTLAADASSRDRDALLRDAGELLRVAGTAAPAGVAIVAQHLVQYPDEELLVRCREALVQLPADADQGEAAAALYCAAALARHVDWLAEIRHHFTEAAEASLVAEQKIEERLAGKDWSPLFLLTVVRPLSLDLNYAVIERMMRDR